MQRIATALVALLAVLALAAAAGSYTAGDGPRLDGGESLGDGGRPEGPPNPGAERSAPNATDSNGSVDDGRAATSAATTGSGGLSFVFVATVVAVLVACAGAALLLTGDDDRAPRPDETPTTDVPQPDPVTPDYDSPADDAVVRAWRRLTDATGTPDSATPTETARLARARGVPGEAVDRLTAAFRAVRYGGEDVDERGKSAAAAMLDWVTEEGEADR